MLLMYYNALKIKKRDIEIGILSSFGIIISFLLLIRTNRYGSGVREALLSVKTMLLFPILELIFILFQKEYKNKRQTKKNVTSDSE